MTKRKSTVSGDRPIINIGYKYNYWKVLYFIFTEYLGIINTDIPYLSHHPYHFDNVNILPVSCPLVLSWLFGSVNEFESQNTPKQSDSALKKY